MKCVLCSSEKILKDLKVTDRFYKLSRTALTIEVIDKSDFAERQAVLLANVCENCGYVMFGVTREGIEILKNGCQE